MLVNKDRLPFAYESNNARETIGRQSAMLEFYNSVTGHTMIHINRVSSALDSTPMVRLPRSWYSTQEVVRRSRWSEDNTIPTIYVNTNTVHVDTYDVGTDKYSSVKQGVISATIKIPVTSDPSWNVWVRWSETIIDQFYEGMRRVRSVYGNPALTDKSNTETESRFDNLTFRYISDVIGSIEVLTTPVEYLGTYYDKCSVKYILDFKLEIPNKPEYDSSDKATGFGSCVIDEETVEVITVRKKRKMRC